MYALLVSYATAVACTVHLFVDAQCIYLWIQGRSSMAQRAVLSALDSTPPHASTPPYTHPHPMTTQQTQQSQQTQPPQPAAETNQRNRGKICGGRGAGEGGGQGREGGRGGEARNDRASGTIRDTVEGYGAWQAWVILKEQPGNVVLRNCISSQEATTMLCRPSGSLVESHTSAAARARPETAEPRCVGQRHRVVPDHQLPALTGKAALLQHQF